MGTSKSFGGPTGSSPLLPPWAPELDPEPDAPDGGANGDGDEPRPGPDSPPPDFREPPTWQGVLGQTTRLARNRATGASARDRSRSVVGNYVRNRGGARSAAKGSVAGRRTAQSLGRFLSDVARSGVEGALRNANLEQYLGGSVEDLLAGFAERFLPAPESLDDAAATTAGLEALYDLLQQYHALDQGIDALDSLDSAGIQHAIQHFISRYIAASVLTVLQQRIETGSVSIDRCEQVELEIRAIIFETVRLDFRGRDLVHVDWSSKETERMIDRLMLDAYSLLEAE